MWDYRPLGSWTFTASGTLPAPPPKLAATTRIYDGTGGTTEAWPIPCPETDKVCVFTTVTSDTKSVYSILCTCNAFLCIHSRVDYGRIIYSFTATTVSAEFRHHFSSKKCRHMSCSEEGHQILVVAEDKVFVIALHGALERWAVIKDPAISFVTIAPLH